MTWTYNAGTTTPTYAGLLELNGIRFNDGSFKTQHLSGIIDTPPVRTVISDLPSDNGGYLGRSYYGPRDASIDGWILATTVEDVLEAREYLKKALAMVDGTALSVAVFNMPRWATRRQCNVRVAGPIVFEEPEITRKKLGRRDFTIPLIAPDPLLYDADNLRSTDLGMGAGNVTLTGAGSMPTPFKARFTGPWATSATLTRTTDGATVTLTMSLSAGQYVDVDFTDVTHPTAVQSTGANVFGNVSATGFRKLGVGSNVWNASAASGTSGASKVTVTWRDAWV